MLTERERNFAALYNGNGAESARRAGVRGSISVCSQAATRMLAEPGVIEIIEARQAIRSRPTIADRNERQEFWTTIMRDNDRDDATRLRAAELLGRSEGDFLDRVQVGADQSLAAIILEAKRRAMARHEPQALEAASGQAALTDGPGSVQSGDESATIAPGSVVDGGRLG